MTEFNQYCEALDLQLDPEIVKRVEDSLGDTDSKTQRDSAMINILTQYYAYVNKENGNNLISSLPVPMVVIHECNLRCIYTINEALSQLNKLSSTTVKSLKTVGAIS